MFVITADEVFKAAEELKKAQERGFVSTEAVLEIHAVSGRGKKCSLRFVDTWDKGEPGNPGQDWGRQGVAKYCRLVGGKLVEDE